MGHLEQTAADKSALGFEYQDLVLVNILLGLKPGEQIGLEVFDDVHTESITQDLCLIQVKHSLSGGNITERDIDLWKTLYNWWKSVPELPPGKNIEFQIYSNKKLNNQNLIVLLKAAKENKEKIIEAILAIFEDIQATEALKAPTDPENPIFRYVKALATANHEEIEFLLERFSFQTDNESIKHQINKKLAYFAVPDSKLDDTRKFVVGAYKEFKVESITSGAKVLITYQAFRVQMGFDRILRSSRSNDVDYDRFYDKYYDFQRLENLSFLGSIFSTQLLDIGKTEADAVEHGIEMLATEELIGELKKEGDFTYQDDTRLEQQCEMSWKNIHKQAHGTFSQDGTQPILAAQACYEKTLSKELKIKNIALPDGFSRGKFIKLSNTPSIGWKIDWQELYLK
ncbi:hypothetical protein [Pseudomonas turukhanskensis]|uniref:CD-NTase associated protein 4-like DNA endonuclease domain-containing protein n=1 Tax=Pseudomonas turukhanskensis TaxID=1806536 RepID=A0A9W6K6R1_9PSED|nr:hypothetical protein [Pseudomonas turukhanskensis]GLK88519.1 hypothetical protein GCM10017655_15810 [Pseudomonas turukhanskensis]